MKVKRYRDRKITEAIKWDGTIDGYRFICDKFDIKDTIVTYRNMEIDCWQFKGNNPSMVDGGIDVFKDIILCKELNMFYTSTQESLDEYMEEIEDN